MTRLLIVELKRFAWRRSFRFFGLVAIGFIILASTIVFFNSKNPATAPETSRSAAISECVRSIPSDQIPPGYGSAEEFCEEVGVPPGEQFDPRFALTSLTDIFGGTSIPLIILGMAFGASFIGAEWSAGTITPLLTWQPRRGVVLLAKVIAVVIGVILSTLAIQTLLGLALWLVAAVRGTTEGADGAWLAETVAVAARGAVIAGLIGALGFAIASVARNTTVALIIGFVYFAVGESILRGLKPGWQPWLIGDNAAVFVIGNSAEVFGMDRSALEALVVVKLYVALALALALVWFKTRDVN